MKTICCLLLILAIVSPVKAADYGWVDIKGSTRFVDTVSRALVLLANRDLEDFKSIVGGGIQQIVESSRSFVYIDYHVCIEHISDVTAYWPYDNQIWLASYPVHERALCWLFQHGKIPIGAQAETFALIRQRAALVKLGAPQYLLDYMDNMISRGPKYQDIPWQNQWW